MLSKLLQRREASAFEKRYRRTAHRAEREDRPDPAYRSHDITPLIELRMLGRCASAWEVMLWMRS